MDEYQERVLVCWLRRSHYPTMGRIIKIVGQNHAGSHRLSVLSSAKQLPSFLGVKR